MAQYVASISRFAAAMARGLPVAMWPETDASSAGYQVGIDRVDGAIGNEEPSRMWPRDWRSSASGE